MTTHVAFLDQKFGEVVIPPRERIAPEELKFRPESRQALNADTGKQLRKLLATASAGLGASRFVYCSIPILWIADSAGAIIFAVEEIHEQSSLEFARPRARGQQLHVREFRLGHPALVNGGGGRIAGEILFDTGDLLWKITNGSGRYGLLPGRLEHHLNNVRDEFAKFEIALTPAFIDVE